MQIQKPICLLLIPFLTISMFANGVAAKSSCNENTCLKMTVRTGPHHSGHMAEAADCCSRHQQVPCELERRQPDEMAVLGASALHFDNHRSVIFIHTADYFPTNPSGNRQPDQRFTSVVSARSSPIYLMNLTLLC
ncbi:MAG: hypothetical protein AB1427_17475 [Thermodesulfobacteriota bacterium]